ncbi:toprim domain-containing protein [Sphingopyxis sp. LARHCG72]
MDSIADIVTRLADNAEAVCRRYLPAGRREGRYWLVGDIHGTPGRSLYVLLSGEGGARGRAGKWTDAASGEHGDLLDIIAASCGHAPMRDTLAEARRFLSLPMPLPGTASPRARKASQGTPAAARRLWAASKPIEGTLVSVYLASRGLGVAGAEGSLRYHPRCYYRASLGDAPDEPSAWPAMIAAVTDDRGAVVGVHRTWLAPPGGKAPVADPRRAMGHLLGHGVRFGAAGEVMAAGEGIETILSLREALPELPMVAGLSAAHLAAIVFPRALRRLYVAFDNDPAGTGALETLAERTVDAGIELVPLPPERGDFNDDLRALGRARLAGRLRRLLRGNDADRFLVR